MKKFYRVMLILFAIHFAVALTVGIVFLIKYRAIPEAGGYVLTDEFIRSDCTRSVYLSHIIFSFCSAFLGLISPAVLLAFGKLHKNGFDPETKAFGNIGIAGISEGQYTNLSIWDNPTSPINVLIGIITTVIILLFAITLLALPFSKTYALLTGVPRIQSCEFERKYDMQDNDGNIRHYIVYSNGEREGVSQSTYNEAGPGDQYYLVYYGNKHIKTYDASVYALPQ